MRSLLLEAVIGSLLVKPFKQARYGSLQLAAFIGSLLMKVVKLLDPSTLEAVGQKWDPFNFEVRGSPCKLALCDDGHELSSLPDQATQG